MGYFFQWVTGRSYYTTSGNINYWTLLKVEKLSSSSSSELKIHFKDVGSKIYMTGVKVGILLVKKTIGSLPVTTYSTLSQSGSTLRFWKSNLGVNTTVYG